MEARRRSGCVPPARWERAPAPERGCPGPVRRGERRAPPAAGTPGPAARPSRPYAVEPTRHRIEPQQAALHAARDAS